ncbi:thermonuclease family protein [Aureimonas ureilytica]|uniref:thermonuclease family protein n=1 Tax=Aureimonas ureilytica TaxID=401562 RepID=UPI000AC20219|nr:thermonuclease family protein [Aureimonas ureilytica]
MQSFRIALGLCALLLAWVLLLPNHALGPVERREAIADIRPVAPVTKISETTSAHEGTPESIVGPVRTIGPVAVELSGPLQRLPAVTSGAAEPVVAEVPAAAPAPNAVAEGETAAAEASATPVAEQKAEADTEGTRHYPFPIAIDSGTIRSGENTIHIAGVEPIAPDARCADGPRSWPCGVRARTEFRAWLRGRTLSCDPAEASSPEGPTACRLGEEDVGEWLVRNGWANAEPGSRYATSADQARKAGRGIWQFEITQQGALQ